MEGVGDEEGNGPVDFAVEVALDQTLKRRHEVRQHVLRDGLCFESIQQSLDDAYRVTRCVFSRTESRLAGGGGGEGVCMQTYACAAAVGC